MSISPTVSDGTAVEMRAPCAFALASTAECQQDRVKPVGQRSGSLLQDQRRLDLDDTVGPHRRDFAPNSSLPDFFRHNLLAAPRGQDGIRCGRDNRFRRDYTVLRCFLDRQAGKHVLSACDLDQLGYPADAADQRIVPFLEIDPWSWMVRHPAATSVRRRS